MSKKRNKSSSPENELPLKRSCTLPSLVGAFHFTNPKRENVSSWQFVKCKTKDRRCVLLNFFSKDFAFKLLKELSKQKERKFSLRLFTYYYVIQIWGFSDPPSPPRLTQVRFRHCDYFIVQLEVPDFEMVALRACLTSSFASEM